MESITIPSSYSHLYEDSSEERYYNGEELEPYNFNKCICKNPWILDLCKNLVYYKVNEDGESITINKETGCVYYALDPYPIGKLDFTKGTYSKITYDNKEPMDFCLTLKEDGYYCERNSLDNGFCGLRNCQKEAKSLTELNLDELDNVTPEEFYYSLNEYDIHMELFFWENKYNQNKLEYLEEQQKLISLDTTTTTKQKYKDFKHFISYEYINYINSIDSVKYKIPLIVSLLTFMIQHKKYIFKLFVELDKFKNVLHDKLQEFMNIRTQFMFHEELYNSLREKSNECLKELYNERLSERIRNKM